MTHGATVQLRVNQATKDRSFSVFKKHGLTLTDGIRIYLERVANEGEIPFSLNVPNEVTAKALAESAVGVGVKAFDSSAEMFAHLHSLVKK